MKITGKCPLVSFQKEMPDLMYQSERKSVGHAKKGNEDEGGERKPPGQEGELA